MRRIGKYLLGSVLGMTVCLLSACGGETAPVKDGGSSYYEQMNYIKIDQMTFRIGDTVGNLLKTYPELETDEADELVTEGIDQFGGHFFDDADGDTLVYASIENRSGENCSSYDGYISVYDLDYSNKNFLGHKIYLVEKDVELPPMILEIIEDFKAISEDSDRMMWQEYEKYKDRLIFIPAIMWEDRMKSEMDARIVVYKDQAMTVGIQYDITFRDDKLISVSLTEDIDGLPGYEKETSRAGHSREGGISCYLEGGREDVAASCTEKS